MVSAALRDPVRPSSPPASAESEGGDGRVDLERLFDTYGVSPLPLSLGRVPLDLIRAYQTGAICSARRRISTRAVAARRIDRAAADPGALSAAPQAGRVAAALGFRPGAGPGGRLPEDLGRIARDPDTKPPPLLRGSRPVVSAGRGAQVRRRPRRAAIPARLFHPRAGCEGGGARRLGAGDARRRTLAGPEGDGDVPAPAQRGGRRAFPDVPRN